MATVPRLDMTGTVGGALPGVRQSSIASPELFGAQASKDIAFGESVSKAGDVVGKIALEEAEKNAVAQVQAARTELGSRTQSYFEEMRKNNVGAAAAGVTQSFRDWHRKQSEEIGKNLTGDVQRAFVQQASQHALAARGEAANFEHGETVKYRTDTYNRTNDNFVAEAARATTDLAYIDARNNLVANVHARAMTEKWDEKQLEDNMRDTLTRMHALRAKALATSVDGAANPKAALEYIKSVDPKEVNPDVMAELTAGLKTQTDRQKALDFVSTKVASMLPTDPKAPIPEKEIDALLEKEFKDNPEGLALARAEKDYRVSKLTHANNEIKARAADRVIDMLNRGMSPAQALASDAALEMSPQALMGLKNQMRARALQEEQIAYTREGRSLQQLQRQQAELTVKFAGRAGEYSDPEFLRGKTRQEVNAMRLEVGNSYGDHLLRLKDSIDKGDDKYQEAKIDHAAFTAAAIRAGVLPQDGTKTTVEEKARAFQLQADIQTRMLMAIADKGNKPLTPTERLGVIQKAVDDAVLIKDPWLFGDKVFRPVGAFTPKDWKDVPEIERKFTEALVQDSIKAGKTGAKATTEGYLQQWRGLHQRPGGFPMKEANALFGPKRGTNPRGESPITKIQSD